MWTDKPEPQVSALLPVGWGLSDLTACCVQSSPAPVAFEMLCLLVIDENLQIIEISFTVVAPWPGDNFIEVGVFPLILDHCACCSPMGRKSESDRESSQRSARTVKMATTKGDRESASPISKLELSLF